MLTRYDRSVGRALVGEQGEIATRNAIALLGLYDIRTTRTRQRVTFSRAPEGVGSFAVQVAEVLGAEATAVSGRGNVVMVRSIVADASSTIARRTSLSASSNTASSSTTSRPNRSHTAGEAPTALACLQGRRARKQVVIKARRQVSSRNVLSC